MSLSSIVTEEVLQRLSQLQVEDYDSIASLFSVGYAPHALAEAVASAAGGRDPQLPMNGGQPRALKINAWSFCSDQGQYHDTYGLSSSRAAEIKDLLRADAEAGRREIQEIVSTRLRIRGSTRPVTVSFDGMPGSAPRTGANQSSEQGADLKREIARDSARYGQYRFTPEDTERPGMFRFRIHLGRGLYATYQNKSGVINVARIARVHGRYHELVRGLIYFMVNDGDFKFGGDVPSRIEFDGILQPGADVPRAPSPKAATAA